MFSAYEVLAHLFDCYVSIFGLPLRLVIPINFVYSLIQAFGSMLSPMVYLLDFMEQTLPSSRMWVAIQVPIMVLIVVPIVVPSVVSIVVPIVVPILV